MKHAQPRGIPESCSFAAMSLARVGRHFDPVWGMWNALKGPVISIGEDSFRSTWTTDKKFELFANSGQ